MKSLSKKSTPEKVSCLDCKWFKRYLGIFGKCLSPENWIEDFTYKGVYKFRSSPRSRNSYGTCCLFKRR